MSFFFSVIKNALIVYWGASGIDLSILNFCGLNSQNTDFKESKESSRAVPGSDRCSALQVMA